MIMSIEYEVRISEKQRKMIMRALTTTVANNRRSTSGGVLSDAAPDDWMELIGVFAALNPHTMVADDQPEHCRHDRLAGYSWKIRKMVTPAAGPGPAPSCLSAKSYCELSKLTSCE